MMAGPADLSYNLPLQTLQGQANQFQGLNGSPDQAIGQLGQNYANAYNSATALNQGIYQGTQTGYNNLRNQLSQQYSDIQAGYQKDYGDVLGQIAGTNATNLKDINTQYAALSGSSMQDAVSRGLGNTTVQQNMQRGIALDQARATTASQNQFAQLQAGYGSQITGQALQAQQQGAQTQANLGQNQLNFGASVSAPYPNAGLYGQLAQMYGAQNEQNKNRALQQQALNQAGARQPVAAGSVGNQLAPFSGPQMGGYGGGSGGYGAGDSSFMFGQSGTPATVPGSPTGFFNPDSYPGDSNDYYSMASQGAGAVGGGMVSGLMAGGLGMGQNPNQGYQSDPYGLGPMTEEQGWQGSGEGITTGI